MQHVKDLLPKGLRIGTEAFDMEYVRDAVPELSEWNVSDEIIYKHRALLLEHIRQNAVCEHCPGYDRCPKDGDMKGFSQSLIRYKDQLTVSVNRCVPYQEYTLHQRVKRWAQVAGSQDQDRSFLFDNFPVEQKRRYPKLIKFAEHFADTFETGKPGSGLYLFGPPGVGKTHLLLAVLNRLQDRGVPCLFVRSDSIFDRMRHIIAENGDLEAFLEACATVPVLGIDEFAQERANEFTLEKLFRIINHRFHAKLPTWFTSNYAPVSIYQRNGSDIQDSVGPMRSRILQMAKLAKIEGDDARLRNLESLT